MENKITGKYIYEHIANLIKGTEEYASALDSLGDDFGSDSSAYRIIKKAYDEKQIELHNEYDRTYLYVQMKPTTFDDIFK